MPQKAMAEFLGCSVDTIQSIETGRLKLSDELAGRISLETGVSLKWLLDDDVSGPCDFGSGEALYRANFCRKAGGASAAESRYF